MYVDCPYAPMLDPIGTLLSYFGFSRRPYLALPYLTRSLFLYHSPSLVPVLLVIEHCSHILTLSSLFHCPIHFGQSIPDIIELLWLLFPSR